MLILDGFYSLFWKRHINTVNPRLSPPGRGWGMFLSNTYGGLNRDRGLIREGGVFNLSNTMMSVLHKELDYKMENLSKSWRSYSQGSKTNPDFQLVDNKHPRSVHTKFYCCD